LDSLVKRVNSGMQCSHGKPLYEFGSISKKFDIGGPRILADLGRPGDPRKVFERDNYS
jgi:hypothetical protein